jgi:hypothetical protein
LRICWTHEKLPSDFFNRIEFAKSGESIEWQAKVEDEGKYLLRFRYAVAGGARPLKVELNGKTT